MPGQHRDRWGTRAAFILAAIGSAVGLGNVWRFPYAAVQGGGGAFLIPYFIALFTAGIPLLMLEYGLGHRMQGSAPASLGRVSRRMEFAGWWAALGGLMITFYYTIIMAWVCFYFWETLQGVFTGVLPWAEKGAGHYLEHNAITGTSDIKQNIETLMPFNWYALGFNALVWIAIYYCIRNGVHSVGKVVWFTVLFPYVLLAILFFTAINLEGASDGLSYYLTPNWDTFTTVDGIAKAASAAYGQIFFSLSIGFGIMIAYASFLPKKSDISNNAVITSLANSGTEFFAGFITFSVFGFLALQQGQFVADTVKGGFGLAFISYPTAIQNLPFDVTTQALVGLAFFGCLLLLGIDSAFSLVEAMVAGVHDKFSMSRRAIARAFCVVGWIIGMVFCTPAGLGLLDVVDHYLADYGLLMVGLLQCIAVGWILGPKKLRTHINTVSERRITIFWDVCIKYVTPLVLIFLLLYQAKGDLAFLWDDSKQPYGNGEYPIWAQLLGLSTLVLGVVMGLVLATRKAQKPDYVEVPEAAHE